MPPFSTESTSATSGSTSASDGGAAPESRPTSESTLELFHPLIRRWFLERVGQPTEIQQLAWPHIADGEHVLVSAPTGSGKTLTAFLWALQQLLTEAWPWPGGEQRRPGSRVLYVSPLRALNSDVRRNLERPLAELRQVFEGAGARPPEVQVMTRSGDTSPEERRRMLRRPPHILITTPESLNILLTSKGGRALLGDLETVILDEIHAVAASKRGTHLITAVERLVGLSGEFQRLALSATVRPMQVIADFVGGFEVRRRDGGHDYIQRPVRILRSTAPKTYDIRVLYPKPSTSQGGLAVPALGTAGDRSTPPPTPASQRGGEERQEEATWKILVQDFKKVVARNRSTLFFANNRRLTERLTRMMNEGEGQELVYSHHGSLSREVRSVVEQRLKDGELAAIVATNSLELGIDIGDLDEVVLVQTPRSVASAVQRVGRAGHGVGQVSRGRLYPTFGRDFLDAAIVARGIREQDIEEMRPITAPLDVLAQVVLLMACSETWQLDDLFANLRGSWPYRNLSRRQFDLVLDMLAGRYADSRIRELRPRISVDGVRGTVKARPGSARLIYMAGGTIADRGYFALRREDTLVKLGELDEEFVWERSIGDAFTLGAQAWQVRKITHNDVLVTPTRGAGGLAPFWRADSMDRDFSFCQKAARFLVEAETRLEDQAFAESLRRDFCMQAGAAEELLTFLRLQKAATGKLPQAERLLVEHCPLQVQGEHQQQIILHTLWGGTVNRPLVIALQAAWEEQYGEGFEAFHDDDAVLIRLPRRMEVTELLALVDPEHVESLLRRRLESTGFFGSRFRANASTSLLLPKTGFRSRTPLWMSRQRAKKLLQSVRSYGDFPILVETWRTCLQDDLDLENLKAMLHRVHRGELPVVEVRTEAPSPFAAGLMWKHTNHYMYQDDSPETAGASGLRQDVLQELVFASHLRPRLPRQLVERFRRKVQRTLPGYAPSPGDDLRDWLLERQLVPADEWRELLAAVSEDHGMPREDVVVSVAGRCIALRLPSATLEAVAAVEALPRLLSALGLSLDAIAPRHLSGEPLAGPLRDAVVVLLASAEGEGGGAPSEESPSEDSPSEDSGDAQELAFSQWLSEWCRFQGPIAPRRLSQLSGLDDEALRPHLEALRDGQTWVLDQLTKGAEGVEICDAENLETLLRWLRFEGRPSFEARPLEELPLFVAQQQGLLQPGDGIEDLQKHLERLFGYPAKAAAWESDILPARLDPYYPSWLDAAVQQSELLWFGCGRGLSSFAFGDDLELFRDDAGHLGEASMSVEPDDAPSELTVAQLFPQPSVRHELGELASRLRLDSSTAALAEDLGHQLWQWAWRGQVSNDTFLALRKGIESKFVVPSVSKVTSSVRGRARRGRRASFNRWQASQTFHGRWFALPEAVPPADALDAEELVKDRVRVLLERYGMVCRELVQRELAPLRWGKVFRTLRLMELSGEVVAGQFFEGIRGLQFMSHGAFRELQKGLRSDAVYWFNASDPASLCGLDLEGLKGTLPARRSTTHLVYQGQDLVLISRRLGKKLKIAVPVAHPRLLDYFEVFKVLLSRQFQPLSSIEIETINGEPALASPYRERLAEVFRVQGEARSIRLWKEY